MNKLIIFFFLFAACLAAGPAGAEQAPAPEAAAESEQEGQGKERWFDYVHRRASSTLLATADSIDDFFTDSRFTAEENRSRARLKLTASYDEEEGLEFKPRVTLRVHLPQVSDQLHLLLFASEDEKPEIESRSDAMQVEEKNTKEVSAGLQYFLKETEKYNISFTGGVSFDYLYGGARYRFARDIGPWKARFVSLLRYYTDDGWENLNTLDFDREFSEVWFFRTTANLDWHEDEDDLSFGLAFRLYQVLGQDRILSYEWENHFEDIDKRGELTDLWLLARYRQQFLRDWLFFEVSPRVNFPRDEDWEPNWGLLFRIEINLGFAG